MRSAMLGLTALVLLCSANGAEAVLPAAAGTHTWLLFDVVAGADREEFQIFIPSDEGGGFAYFLPYEATGRLKSTGYLWVEEYGASAGVGVGGLASEKWSSPDVPTLSIKSWIEGFRNGQFQLVVLVVGDFSRWWMETTPGVTLRDTGVVHVFEAGDLPAGAQLGASGGGASAHASVGGALTFEIENTLLGLFNFDALYPPLNNAPILGDVTDSLPLIADEDVMTPFVGASSLTGPSATRECPCSIRHIAEPEIMGPGSYEFRIDGAGVMPLGEPIVVFADIPVTRP